MERDIQLKLDEIMTWLQAEFSAIRTGQATPALLDSVKVESYGALLPLNQMSNVGAEDARTLRITPWDLSQITALEKALREADLGLSVAADSTGVRAVFPELTIERREQLQKLSKSKLEEARIRVRTVRDEVMKAIDKKEKDGDLSEDGKFSAKESVQEKINNINKKLEDLQSKKVAELQS